MSLESERDTALAIAKRLEATTDKFGVFVLTGSYSIDALTHDKVKHNDIDANLFVRELSEQQTSAIDEAITSELPAAEKKLQRLDRLEYNVGPDIRFETAEIQLVDYEQLLSEPGSLELILPGVNDAGNDIRVPLSNADIIDSRGSSHEFRVKSLSYAIATWAIRISGVINYQKRPVRQTDKDHFALLLNQPYQNEEVCRAIAHHPQMIAESPENVIDKAKQVIGA